MTRIFPETAPMGRIHGGLHLSAMLIALAMVLTPMASAQFEQDDPFPPLGMDPWPPTLETIAPDGGFPSGGTVRVKLKVVSEAGVHVYRDELRVETGEAQGLSFLKLEPPEGKAKPDPIEEGKTIRVLEGEFTAWLHVQVDAVEGGEVRFEGTLAVQGCTDDICYAPADLAFEIKGVAGPPVPGTENGKIRGGASSEASVTAGGDDELEALWYMVIIAFWAGILLSLSPCVLPMIPITSAIILRFSTGGKVGAFISSCLYVLGVSITYSVLGVLIALVGGSIRSVFADPIFLSVVAGIFVLLALSMFGLYDLALPAGITGKLQRKSSQTGKSRLGLLAMGMISGLVLGPCVTAPLAYILVFIAKSGSWLYGFIVMFALSWGMGLLIIAAGTSTNLVPKAGPWMEWVRRFFGFVMIWGALFFVTPVIGDTAYLAGTAAVLVVGAVFLGGLDSLPSDARWPSRVKKLIGVLALFGAFWLILDLHGSLNAGKAVVAGGASGGDVARVSTDPFTDGGSAELGRARAEGTPAVVYFTASWCKICKVFKKNTLTRPEVASALAGTLALRVDYDAHRDLVDDLEVPGPPTVLFFGPDGAERQDLRLSGNEDPDAFIARIEAVKSGVK